MPKSVSIFPWKTRFSREITLVLVLKIAILLAIKLIWFSAPPNPANGTAFTSAHLLGNPPPSPHSTFPKEP